MVSIYYPEPQAQVEILINKINMTEKKGFLFGDGEFAELVNFINKFSFRLHIVFGRYGVFYIKIKDINNNFNS